MIDNEMFFAELSQAKPVIGKKPTDVKYFEKLADQFLEFSKYNIRSWNNRDYAYDGTRWSEIQDLPNRLRLWMRQNNIPQNNNIVGNVVPIIKAVASVQCEGMPTWIGESCPFGSDVVAFKNGILDVKKYLAGDATLCPHSRNWFSSFCLPFAYDPSASCPQWLQFLEQVYEGDLERVALLQEWFGYCLLPDTSQQKMLMMVGKPRSGKGTIQHILKAMVGADNSTGFSLTSLADTFGIHCLLNKLVAFVGEVDLQNNRMRGMILERLKSIVGEDTQRVEEKYMSSVSALLPSRFCIACNQLPSFLDPSGALGKRLLILDHDVSFSGREDTGLKEKLSSELSGIANWSLGGLSRLREKGKFTEPKTMKNSVQQFMLQSSPVLCFIRDCCVVQTAYDPGDLQCETSCDDIWVERDKLFLQYQQWCLDNDRQEASSAYFGQDLQNSIPKIRDKEVKKMVNGKRVRVYPGIALKANSDDADKTTVEGLEYSVLPFDGEKVFVKIDMRKLTPLQTVFIPRKEPYGDGIICHPHDVEKRIAELQGHVDSVKNSGA
ncbi:MAG: hypothetical protein C0467_21910 [Planctomycetaceae bacterium]|nr:hypothetical protein [Planctomycetaceae bacterium]